MAFDPCWLRAGREVLLGCAIPLRGKLELAVTRCAGGGGLGGKAGVTEFVWSQPSPPNRPEDGDPTGVTRGW